MFKERCPIRRLAGQLEGEGILSRDDTSRLEAEARRIVDQALRFVDGSPYPDQSEVLTDVD